MRDLFEPISRDERQAECIKKWFDSKGKGTLECCTGFGKSRCALIIINKLLKRYPQMRIWIVVPTELLKKQWEKHVENFSLQLNVEVLIINSAAKNGGQCDFLIIDEIHTAGANLLFNVFQSVKYKLILGLTATFERLDERHKLIAKYCPIVDTVTLQEAQLNGWVATYKEYLVLIDVADSRYLRPEKFEGIENFMYIPGNVALIEQFLTNFKDIDVMDVYQSLQAIYRSNRYEMVRENTL
jgi:superfamily II DNA or RNA helicase